MYVLVSDGADTALHYSWININASPIIHSTLSLIVKDNPQVNDPCRNPRDYKNVSERLTMEQIEFLPENDVCSQ